MSNVNQNFGSCGNFEQCVMAKPLFKDRKKFCEMADPTLEGQYPVRGLYQVLAIAAMCVQEQPSMRPLISDVVTALNYLASHKYYPNIRAIRSPSGLKRDGQEKYDSNIYSIHASCNFKEDDQEEKFVYDYVKERSKSE
ncbi:hypothetical protein BUALT_Bualt13G0082500 [Buddleja alternifolia]|uniref:Uncharacterized protein n=1 Tax=Buddleja alternifolia TaxID=168488 RepID=A0AAV6WUT5_9LAMI|nr:hypothetical protein BUALT_Bualt13G0082500 [Buddleja alternifolia]